MGDQHNYGLDMGLGVHYQMSMTSEAVLASFAAAAEANEPVAGVVSSFSDGQSAFLGESMPLRMRVHDREPIGAALRRFKKLLERSGLQKELRKRKHYEKPCEIRRRAQLRKQSAIRKAKNMPMPTQ
jgi:small subunit ribosomal protein S21